MLMPSPVISACRFREEMTTRAADPYSVVLRRKKIPMGLIVDSQKVRPNRKTLDLSIPLSRSSEEKFQRLLDAETSLDTTLEA
jgi:hypothetical protein